MLDASLKEQLQSIFASLEASYTFDVYASPQHESYAQLLELLEETAACSSHIQLHVNDGTDFCFKLLKDGKDTGVSFRGIPNGHEFTSLLLALLNSDGKGKNLPDEFTVERIKALSGTIKLSTYVSLTCTNCPDVVQALNIIAILNPNISHSMVDGALFEAETKELKIQAVPAVFADGELFHIGRGDLGELLAKLEAKYGSQNEKIEKVEQEFDVVVVGGGPAGSAAAVYSARKGLKVAVLAERIGGQVKETLGIENLISVPHTTGETLASDLKRHMQDYPIALFEHRSVESLELDGKDKVIHCTTGERFRSQALIIATGAKWRRLNVPGEAEYIGRGVAFCPHCDGPFYKGKHVAVIGGGNSGIEAAIDLAGICSKVSVFEFMEELKADRVLQEKLASLPNVEVFLNTQSTEVVGNGEKVVGLRMKDRATGEEREVALDGIFVQIGLAANSEAFRTLLNVNRAGEIEIDTCGRTSVPGIYAAGDVSTVAYKQIIISMGEGAKAALAAFDDRIRGAI